MSDLWSDQQLADWRATIPSDWPDWRQDYHEDMRRDYCPTAREKRASLRRKVKSLCLDQVRKARIVPGWLTEAGQIAMRQHIARYRAEHSKLVGLP